MSFDSNLLPPYSAPKQLAKDHKIRQQPIKVYCRVKPITLFEKSSQLQVNKQENTVIISDNIKNISKTFSFNRIFTEDDSQNYVIQQICEPIIQSYNQQRGSLIFTYGVTNSGKTHTILGTPQDIGILPYLLKTLSKPIYVTGIEIYNDQFFSLSNRQKLQPRQNGGYIQFKEYESEKVYQENIDIILAKFMENRNQNDTKMNEKSSRSHAIFRIQSNNTTIGVVDLAGSQRTNKIGGNIQQTSSINKSLLCLGRCIQALKQQTNNSSVQVPYRQSKLTKVLMEYFGPNFNVYMIANLNQSQSMLHQNLKVLEYAAVAKDIKHNLSKSTMSHIIKNSIEKSQKHQRSQIRSAIKQKKKDNYVVSNSQLKSILTSRIKSNKKNIIRECQSEEKNKIQQYEGTIKFLNQQIIRILKVKKLDQCIHRLQGIQQEMEFNFQSQFQKEREEDINYMNKLKQQCISPTQKSQRIPRFVNTSMNTIAIQDPHHQKIRLSLKNQLMKQLQKTLEEQKFKKMQQRGTVIGSSIKKIFYKKDPIQSKLQQILMKSPNIHEKHQFEEQEIQAINSKQHNNSFLSRVVKKPIQYIKSSAQKLYSFTSNSLTDIIQISSKKLKNRAQQNKKNRVFQIVSFNLYQKQNCFLQRQYTQIQIQTQAQKEQILPQSVFIFQDEITQTETENSHAMLKQQKKQRKNKASSNTQNTQGSNDQKILKASKCIRNQINKAPSIKVTPIKNRLRSRAKN